MLIEEMAHFDRERIPERVVHAKGAGAFGYFEVNNSVLSRVERYYGDIRGGFLETSPKSDMVTTNLPLNFNWEDFFLVHKSTQIYQMLINT